jgi:hypothetical protein
LPEIPQTGSVGSAPFRSTFGGKTACKEPIAMKYACLVYAEPGFHLRLPPEELKALDRDSLAYDSSLAKAGHFLAASALSGTDTARTIRVRGGKVLATDGPFAETKEVLCGFIFIEAPDAATARRIAEGIPMARYGTIELRPELIING